MSDKEIRSLQKDVCKQIPELPPLKKLCPRCKPNPNYIEPDWTSIPGETYLNERTCEYQVCVTINEVGKSMVLGLIDEDPRDSLPPRLPEDPVERRRILRSYVHPAITIMLEDQGKLVTDQIICAYHEGPTMASLNPEDVILLLNNNDLEELYQLMQADPLTDRCRDETDTLEMQNYFPEFPPDEPIDNTARMAQIISSLPEIKNPLALELHTYVRDFYIDPFDSMLKVLIATPAHIFDSVPNVPTKDELDKQSKKLIQEVELDVEQLYGQIKRLRAALYVYSGYQSYFENVDGGNLKLFFNDQKYKSEPDYYCLLYSNEVNSFYKSLRSFAKKNGWNIKSNIKSVALQNASKIKITFDTSDEKNPYVISKIEVKKIGCSYVNITKKFDKFFITKSLTVGPKKTPRYNSIALGYIAKLKEIDIALRARQSYPWLEFLMKFTWPTIKIDYGDQSEEKIKDDAGDCVAKNALTFGLDMKNYILNQSLNMVEILDYEYNRKGCSQLESFENEPEVTEFKKDFKNVGREAKQEVKEVKQQQYQDEFLRKDKGGSSWVFLGDEWMKQEWNNEQHLNKKIEDYKKILAETKKEFEDDKKKLDNKPVMSPTSFVDSIEWKENKSFLEQRIEYNTQAIKDIPKAIGVLEEDLIKYRKSISKEIRKERRKEEKDKDIKKARKTAEKEAKKSARNNNHPYVRKARAAALEELKSQNSILTSLIDMETWKQKGGGGLKFDDQISLEDLKDRMTYCSVKSLTVQGIRCLVSGVTQKAALKKIIRVALEEMDIDVFGIFIKNLPPASQVELRQQFEQEFGNLPLPWEEGYDPGSMDNTNPYTKALKLSNFERKKKIDSPKATAQTHKQRKAEKTVTNFMKPDELYINVDQVGRARAFAEGEQALPVQDALYSEDKRMIQKVSYQWNNDYHFDSWISTRAEEDHFREWISSHGEYSQESFEVDGGAADTLDSPSPTELGNKWVKSAFEKYGEDYATDYTWDFYDVNWTTDPLGSGVLFKEEEIEEEYEWGAEEVQPLNPELTSEKEFQQVSRRLEGIEKETELLASAEEELTALLEESALTKKWKDLSDEEKEQYKKSAIEKKDPHHKGTYGAALGNIQKLITDAYIKNMMDMLQIDQLMSVLERFPGAELLPRILNKTGCASQGLFNPPMDSFLSTFALDTCGDLGVGLGTPKMIKNPLPNFFDRNVMTKLRNQFIETVEKTWTKILTDILIKVLQSVDAAICKGFNALAKATASSMGLDNAIADTFCPDGDQADVNNTKNKLFQAAGIVPDGIGKTKMSNGKRVTEDSYECLFRTINATTSRQEILNLLVESKDKMDQKVLRRIAELTNSKCPEFASVFGTPEKVAEKFMRVSNFVPVELRKALQDELSKTEQAPIFQSICLTQTQKDEWDKQRINLLTDKGLDEVIAEKMINNANQRALIDLGSLSKLAEKGVDGFLGEAFGGIVDPASPYDEPCKNKNIENIFENEDSKKEKTDAIQILFEIVEKKFLSDIIKGNNGVLNNILRDKNNFRLTKHELRTSYPFIWANYADSEEKWQYRKDNANLWVSERMKESWQTGFYPETVGIRMRNALLDDPDDDEGEKKYRFISDQHDGEYNKNYQIKLLFEDNPEDKQYEFSATYNTTGEMESKKRITVNETFYRKLSKKEAESLGIDPDEFGENPMVSSGSTDILYTEPFDLSEYSIDDEVSYPHEYAVFRSLLEKHLGQPINNFPYIEKHCDKIKSDVFNFTKNSILKDKDGNIPIGFKFGYSDQKPITFEDLHYVNPDANPDDKKTWVYTHMPQERVLGKSATENPRVHFLDPAIHGGSYAFPKIYIEPATYNGWLGMVKTFIPEVQKCEHSDNGFLNVTEIAKRVKEVEKNTKFDKRLSLAPDCNTEIPFDKQFAPATHGLMEGIVISTIKVYATELILRTLPTFCSVEFSKLNVDTAFEKMLIQEMKKDLTSQTTVWNLIQGYTYYLLFLEQAVQVVQRQMNDELIDSTPELEKAFAVINDTMESFKAIKINPKELIKNPKAYDYSDILEIFKGSAIIGFGEDFWEEEYNRLINPESYKTAATKIYAGALSGSGAVEAAEAASTFGLSIDPLRTAATGIAVGGALTATGIAVGATIAAATDPTIQALNQLVYRLGALTPFKIELARRIFTIHNVTSSAEVIMAALIKKELSVLMKKITLDLRPRPYVSDITKYMLSKNGIVVGSTLRSGESEIEQPTVEGATGFDYGRILDVVRDPETENPINSLILPNQGAVEYIENLQKGFFYLERYVRVFEKPPVFAAQPEVFEEPTTITGPTSETTDPQPDFDIIGPDEYTGQVYNIKEFQELLPTLGLDPESFISDNFGNATIAGPEIKQVIRGTIGVKFGVRLIFCPPQQVQYFTPDNYIDERTFQFPVGEVNVEIPDGFQRFPVTNSDSALPVAVFEQDVFDKKMSEIDMTDENMGEDLKCYIDNLVASKDFQTLFGYCFSPKSFVSLLGIYTYYGFFESIGKDITNIDEVEKNPRKLKEKWKRQVFKGTKKELRKTFNSIYRTDDDDPKEKSKNKKEKNTNFLANLAPSAFLNLDLSSVKWWQSLRIVEVRPFDPDGKECPNPFQKVFMKEK